jgi:hypothetical protein
MTISTVWLSPGFPAPAAVETGLDVVIDGLSSLDRDI